MKLKIKGNQFFIYCNELTDSIFNKVNEILNLNKDNKVNVIINN